DIVLIRPRQDAVAELGHLLAVLDDDRILADQVDTADVAVEVDAHAGPVEPRRHLLDVGRLAGPVVAGDDHPAVLSESGEDRQRGGAIEAVVAVDIRHVLVGLRVGRHFHIAIDSKHLPDRHLHVRQAGVNFGSHCSSVASYVRGANRLAGSGSDVAGNLAESRWLAIAVRPRPRAQKKWYLPVPNISAAAPQRSPRRYHHRDLFPSTINLMPPA